MVRRMMFFSLISVVSYADAQEQPSTAHGATQEDRQLLEEIVIRNIRQQDNETVARSLIVQEDIETKHWGGHTQFFLESFTPSLVTSSQGGNNFGNYGDFRLRGMEASRVNVTLNGVPLNGPVDYALYFSNFADITQSMESIEIQRGVGTSTNGIASYAGSISLQSKNIFSTKPSGEVGGTIGSFGTRRLHTAYTTGKNKDGFSSYLRASALHSEGYRAHSGTTALSALASSGYQNKQYTLKVTALTGRTQNEMAYGHVPLDAIKKDPKANPTNTSETDDYAQSFVMLEQHYALSASSIASGTVYYGNAAGYYLWGYEDEEDYFQSRNSLIQSRLGGMANIEVRPTGRNFSVRFGGHLYTFSKEEASASMPHYTQNASKEHFAKEEVSFFIKSDYRPGQWLFSADLQARSPTLRMRPSTENITHPAHHKFFSRNWFFVSPKAGLSYKVRPRWTVYSSFAYTEREPTHRNYVGDDYVLNDGNLSRFTENQIKPEKVTDVEYGVRHKGTALSLEANGFLMFFENEIVPSGLFLPKYYLNTTQSLPSSQRIGVEGTLRWDATRALRLSLLTTLMQHRTDERIENETNGTYESFRAPFTPTQQYRPSIQYKLHGFTVGLSGQYLSEGYLSIPNRKKATLPAFFVLDGQVSYQFGGRYFLSARLNNALNTLYYTQGSTDGALLPSYIVQPPRHIFLQLRMKI